MCDDMVYLFRDPLGCLFGIMTLVNDIADLLTVHDEVDAISGERQEGVVHVMQLVDRHIEQHELICTQTQLTRSYTRRCLYDISTIN